MSSVSQVFSGKHGEDWDFVGPQRYERRQSDVGRIAGIGGWVTLGRSNVD